MQLLTPIFYIYFMIKLVLFKWLTSYSDAHYNHNYCHYSSSINSYNLLKTWKGQNKAFYKLQKEAFQIFFFQRGIIFLKTPHLRIFFYWLLERAEVVAGAWWGWYRERNIHRLPLILTQTMDWTWNLLVCKITLQPTEPYQPGQLFTLLIILSLTWGILTLVKTYQQQKIKRLI